VNKRSLLDPAGSVTVCRALTMEQDWGRSWQTRKKGSPGASADGTRVVLGGPVRDEQGCPEGQFSALPGDRLDFVFSLKGSGDGKAPTTVYLGKKSINVRGTDC
jgi:hypothetical protein